VARRRGVGGTLVLDSEGLIKLAEGQQVAHSYLQVAIERGSKVVISAVTLAEVIQGGPKDANIHRVLSKITVVPVSQELGRAAGELISRADLRTGADAHRCTVDAIVAATAMLQERPVVLLTSDPGDMARLTEEPDQPREDRIAIVPI
jgi:predicted nucleic acid-binding protein